jgi:hypothetical protein
MQKMTIGKRDLLLQDPNSAVEHLAEACEMLGKLYGETAQECGDAYFYYGKALLELGRLEAGVIDNVLDGGKHAPTFYCKYVVVLTPNKRAYARSFFCIFFHHTRNFQTLSEKKSFLPTRHLFKFRIFSSF